MPMTNDLPATATESSYRELREQLASDAAALSRMARKEHRHAEASLHWRLAEQLRRTEPWRATG